MSAYKKKKLPPKVEDMTKEEIIVFLKKKRECEASAQSIVIGLLENVTELDFINCLPFINQNHYDDVTEERAIAKLCGYPLCSKIISDKLPLQQFKISCRTNRVYDITARKNFCSNGCYKASVYIKEQILTSPLWCREKEDIPSFNLLRSSEHMEELVGDPVDLSIVKKIDVNEPVDNSFKSFLDFTQASLTELSLDSEGKNVAIESLEIICKPDNDSVNINKVPNNVDKTGEDIKKINEAGNDSEQPNIKKESNKRSVTMNKILGDVVEKNNDNNVITTQELKMNASSDITTEIKRSKFRKVRKVENKPLSAAIIHIEKCLGEWFSLETMLFLFGEVRAREMVASKGEDIKGYLNNVADGLLYKSTSYDQYQLLCKKLSLLEIEDRKFDVKTTNPGKDLKPIPDYSKLQEENKTLDIKVRAFLKGNVEIKETVVENETESLTNLPLVDKTAQHALRRKIVLNGLNKVLPDLVQALGLSFKDVNSNIRLLIATFNLQAHNIIFKSAQWNMIVIILIKLLAIRDVGLGKALERDVASRHMQLLLMSYEQDGGYLDRLISWLTDVDRLLDNTEKQLTNL